MKTPMRIALLLLLAPFVVRGQSVPELAPAVARLHKTYDKTPDGTGFFNIAAAAPELRGTGLWIRYGDRDTPPVRIDRMTGAVKIVGAKGKGPNEDTQPTDMVSGEDGTIGVRDPGRLTFFWVDKDGVQRRTWPVPTTNNMQGKTFTDAKGRLYIAISEFVNGRS